jgi:hypothetical protein
MTRIVNGVPLRFIFGHQRALAVLARRSHGKTASPEYEVWCGIKKRCYNARTVGYKNYGGRGITVCDSWLHDFAAFLADMGERPTPFHSIERVNNDGNYEPSNCRWGTRIEQNNNKRNNARLVVNGETMSARSASKLTGIPYFAIIGRRFRGIDNDKLLQSFEAAEMERRRKVSESRTAYYASRRAAQ